MATTEGRETDSGIEIEPVYTADDVEVEPELPGEFPFTRGPYPDMYRGRPWTIRQYAGFASAEETNARFRYLLERGQTGLSVAFDLPTQLGYDSDDARAAGEVGRTGVAIDSLADMELLFEGIPLDRVSTSMTINAPAALLLLLYELVAEGQGVPGSELRGTVQNDILKEYCARGNYIFPPRPSMRITTDVFAYCHERLPLINTISISGYHIREAGATAAQELAFTLANGIAYCQAAVDAGLSPDEFGARLSFFFNAHNHFFQEIAKFRAARRMWAGIMRDRFGATNPKAQALRFHAQTGGSTLTAQQPENNIVRVAVQALSAVCGGAQSIHTNGFDEALALPTERSARIALRTQQILAAEAGGTDTADPLGGAYFIEAMTNELEEHARELIDRVDELGGAVAAIEQGFVQREIEEAAFRYQPRSSPASACSSASTASPRTGTGRSSCTASIPPLKSGSSSAPRACGPSATPRRPRPRCRRCGALPGRERTSSRHARRPPRPLHRRRDLRGAPRGVLDVRRAARVSAALRYHRATDVRAGGTDEDEQRLVGDRPPPFKDYGDAERLPLDVSVAGPLLQDGAGIVRSQKGRDYGGGTIHWRAYSSAGGLFPVEAYVAARDGLYSFDALTPGFVRVEDGDARAVVAAAAGADAETFLVLTGLHARTGWKYLERGYRHVWWDAGTMLANLLALAAARGLEPRLYTAFRRR